MSFGAWLRANKPLLQGLIVLAMIGLLVMLIVQSGQPPPRLKLPDRLPRGETPQQHVAAQRAAEIDRRFAQGVEMMQRREYQFAITAFHRVLELDPTIADAHVNLGFALHETGDHAGAQRFFEAATRLNPQQLNAYYGMGLAAYAQGNFEVAAGAMRSWLHLAPASDPFRAKAEQVFRLASDRLAR